MIGFSGTLVAASEAVDDGDDKAPDAVFSGTVGRDAHGIEAPVHADDLPVDRGEVLEHVSGIRDDVLIGKTVGEYLHGSAHILAFELEFAAYVFGELANIEMAVHKEDTDHGGRQEV